MPEIANLQFGTSRFLRAHVDHSYALSPDDRPDATVPVSFPAKLLALLTQRFRDGMDPQSSSCELRSAGNGRLLRQSVLDLAVRYYSDPRLMDWLQDRCVFANRLVDRIVTGDIEPVGAIAEPFALWAIEHAPGVSIPFHASGC